MFWMWTNTPNSTKTKRIIHKTEQDIGGLSKKSANLTCFYPNTFDFMGCRDIYSNNSSAVSIVNLFPMCKGDPQCVVTLKYIFTAVVTLENGC